MQCKHIKGAPALASIIITHLIIILRHAVSVAPTITTSPDDGTVNVMEGESVTLECDADGKPEPTVSWSQEVSIFKFIIHNM